MKESQENVKHAHQISQMSVDVGRNTMKELLGSAADSNHGERGLDDHALIPSAFRADFEIIRNALRTAKAQIRESNGLTVEGLNKRIEILVGAVHRCPPPAYHPTLTVENPAQLDANGPPPFVFVLLAHLLRATSRSDRENQLDGEAIHHRKQGRPFQQTLTPALIRFQHSLQARPLWQALEHLFVIPLQPPTERPEPPPLSANRIPIVTISLGYSSPSGCFTASFMRSST